MDLKKIYSILFIIPAIVIFFIALIPTLKYQWPLSWDIIYHVQYAKIYAQYGFVLTDPLLNAPSGQNINYPPLFHFLIAGLGTILKIDYFQLARFMQPFLAMFIVLSVSYVAKKLYGNIAGISAGFLIISSYLITRIILPIPENLALIFLPLAVYFYYRSINEGILKYALIAGFMFVLTLLTHLVAPEVLFLVITIFTIITLILNRNISVLKNYGAFLSFLIILLIVGLTALLLLKPDFFNSITHQGLALISSGIKLNYNQPMSALSYIKNIGPLVLIFAVIGGIFALKKRNTKHMLMFIWILAMFLLSNAYWFGINVVTYRVLIYLLIPLSILGGFGLSQVYYKLKEYSIFSSRPFRSLLLISIFALSTFLGVLTVEDPTIANFGSTTKFGYIQISPPSDSEIDMTKWFNENGNKSRSVLISNIYSGYILATESWMPIHYKFENFNKSTPKSVFEKEKIGYIVYDKRLTFASKNKTIDMKLVYSLFGPLYYFNGDIHAHINEIIPDYAKVVYENKDFIICKIEY
jgi:4-amino-4-deoxy-L-arabinose transferase-like glycosyltransferase